MFNNLILTYQCFKIVGITGNWFTLVSLMGKQYGKLKKKKKTYQTELYAMHWTLTFAGLSTFKAKSCRWLSVVDPSVFAVDVGSRCRLK